MTYTTSIGQIGYCNMHGEPIPFSVNPGPQVTCPGCKLLRFGADMRRSKCVYCLKARRRPKKRKWRTKKQRIGSLKRK